MYVLIHLPQAKTIKEDLPVNILNIAVRKPLSQNNTKWQVLLAYAPPSQIAAIQDERYHYDGWCRLVQHWHIHPRSPCYS